ncbi:putative carboxylesterase [Abeliophyllum distichum]|uniref:Carboxylesterase n=1 Tax=Abeliophyllum distichum TaxID=126358 RepID=A0ABD1P8M7_9LAMI
MCCKSSIQILIVVFTLCSLSIGFAANSTDILYEVYPFIRVYQNGTIHRFIGTERVPASFDPTTGVKSKDIQISPELNLLARFYIPENASHKLPLLIYIHGGGFFTESAFSPTYHRHLNSLVAKANVIALSIEYRLAPENPLPITYEDSWIALKWAVSHSKGNGHEVWLNNYADFGRVYLGGDSAGANIVHNMAMRVGLESPEYGVKLSGVFLNCPYFTGKNPIGNEIANMNGRNTIVNIWLRAYPNSTGLDDPLVNPVMDPKLSKLGCKRVLIFVSGNDFLRDRGWYYKEALYKSGWTGNANVVEAKGEDHVFNLIYPTSPKAIHMLKTLASFLNQS